MGQKCAGPRWSCFSSEQQSSFSDRMGTSHVLQPLLFSQVFTASGGEEGEKHLGTVEAAGDVRSTTSDEAAQRAQA